MAACQTLVFRHPDERQDAVFKTIISQQYQPLIRPKRLRLWIPNPVWDDGGWGLGLRKRARMLSILFQLKQYRK
jgi:hypothetical protein